MADSFIHAADLHLGAPLQALAWRTDPAKAAHLRALAATAFDRLVDAALDRGVAFVVIAGDVYDNADREVAAQFRFHRALERLDSAGITVFMVHGNHDPLQARYVPVRPLPKNVYVFGAGAVQEQLIETPSGQTVRVAGVSFATQHESENLAGRFAALTTIAETPTVAVLHANVGGQPGHGRYAECQREHLASAPVDYWALGHIHKRSLERLSNDSWMAYSGNIQGRSTKASECGPKGALAVPIDDGAVGEAEFFSCDGIRFERRPVDLTDADDLGEVVDLMEQATIESVAQSDDRPLLLHLDLVGSTAVHSQLGDAESILSLAKQQFGSLFGDGELVSVRVQSRPAFSREQLLERHDLLSHVLSELNLIDRSADQIRVRLSKELLGSAPLKLISDRLSEDELLSNEIWQRAESLLMDALLTSSGEAP